MSWFARIAQKAMPLPYEAKVPPGTYWEGKQNVRRRMSDESAQREESRHPEVTDGRTCRLRMAS